MTPESPAPDLAPDRETPIDPQMFCLPERIVPYAAADLPELPFNTVEENREWMLSHEPLTLRYKHREDVEELVVGYARGNLVRGMIDEVDGERVAHLASSLLSDEYRGDGEGRFGSRLYQRFVKEAKAKGAVWLTGDTPSGRAFAVRLRLFGTDNTECFDKHLRSIRIDEAVEKAGYGLKFYARHDLRKVDTTDW